MGESTVAKGAERVPGDEVHHRHALPGCLAGLPAPLASHLRGKWGPGWARAERLLPDHFRSRPGGLLKFYSRDAAGRSIRFSGIQAESLP